MLLCLCLCLSLSLFFLMLFTAAKLPNHNLTPTEFTLNNPNPNPNPHPNHHSVLALSQQRFLRFGKWQPPKAPHGGAPRVLLVFPGVGCDDHHHWKSISRSLDIIAQSQVMVLCLMIVYVEPDEAFYAKENDHIREGMSQHCQLLRYPSGKYTSNLKTVVPELVDQSGFTHVFILLHDVQLQKSFSLSDILNVMERNHLSVSSPAIINGQNGGSTWRESISTNSTTGYLTTMIEVFATLYTAEAWRCWWDLLDPAYNQGGWGYDAWLYQFCNERSAGGFRMGVVYYMLAEHQRHSCKSKHNPPQHPKTPTEQADEEKSVAQTHRNITLKESWGGNLGPLI